MNISSTSREQPSRFQAERRFQAAIEAVSDIVWTNNAVGEMEGEQPTWAAFTGQSYEEYQGYGWAKAVHPDDAQPTIDEWNKSVAARRTFVFRHRVRRHDGEYRLCSIKAVPVLDDEGTVREWVGIHEDVTDVERARIAILERDERYRDLLTVITDITWISDHEGRLVTPQPKWQEYTGQTWEEYHDFGWLDAVHPESRKHLWDSWAKSRDSREFFKSECRVWHAPTLEWRCGVVKAVPRLNQDGSLREWVGSCDDVENEKRAHQAVEDAARKFRFLAESIPQKIFTAKPNGDVDYFNPQWVEFTGLSFEQIRDWGWTQFVHPDDVEENIRLWKHSIDTGEPFRYEHRFRRADGIYRWHLSRAHAMRDDQGAILRWTGSNTDIHEQKQAEDILLHKVKERTSAVHRLSLKVLTVQDEEHRSISRELHDSMGQHLASMKMIADQLKSSALTEQQGELLSGMSESLDICIKETRTISHLLHPPLLDELGFASAARWYTAGFSERSGISVDLEFSNESQRLPRSVELPLFRVLQASLSNVHRHAKSPSVIVRFAAAAQEVRLEVKDCGQGIDAELLAQFNQTGTGSGIGLAGMRERMAELGGRLEIESTSRGTLVRAVCPL